MLSLFHLAQKSCLAGKLFLTHLPSLPSLPIWRFLNLKLAWSLQKLQRLLTGFSFFKKKKKDPTAFFPWHALES